MTEIRAQRNWLYRDFTVSVYIRGFHNDLFISPFLQSNLLSEWIIFKFLKLQNINNRKLRKIIQNASDSFRLQNVYHNCKKSTLTVIMDSLQSSLIINFCNDLTYGFGIISVPKDVEDCITKLNRERVVNNTISNESCYYLFSSTWKIIADRRAAF